MSAMTKMLRLNCSPQRDDFVRLLTTNLNKEKADDKKLSTVALRTGLNGKAAS